jgi:hypothetical protein
MGDEHTPGLLTHRELLRVFLDPVTIHEERPIGADDASVGASNIEMV